MALKYRLRRAPQAASDPPVSGTTTAGVPTGTNFVTNPSASAIPITFAQSNPSTSTSAPASTSAAADPNPNISVEQPIPVRTLVAICVAAFILVAGLVIFVLWFGARSRRAKASQNSSHINGLDYLKGGHNADGGTTTGTAEEVNLKGFPVNNTTNAVPPFKAGLASDQSSYYSQSTGRKPSQVPYNSHMPGPTADSFDHQQQQGVYTIPANYSATYADEQSFLPKQNVYTRNDMAPVSPRSASAAIPAYPQQGQQGYSSNEPVSQPSPRSQSAQAIVRPYVVGAHPYASQPRGGSSHGRPSIEHSGNYTVATAFPEPDGGLGINGHNYQQHASSTSLSYGGSPNANSTFAAAGVRPGYDAYGIEPKQTPTATQHTHTRSHSAGRQPIQNISARPSLESIRSIARKASIDRTAVEAATDFVNGGPQAVGASSRSRNNSIGSSTKGRGAVLSGGSMYGGAAGAGYTASVYSARSGKEGKNGGTKEKLSKSEKKREMQAMDNLIAALDESALRERRRKEALAEAAGVGNGPTHAAPGSSAAAGGNESDGANTSRRRQDPAITGSYPLPPADVFRAALAPPTRGQEFEVDDELDDEEIERWRRR